MSGASNEPAQSEFLDAHSRNDLGRLVELYSHMGNRLLEQGEIDAGCFFLTHSYVFALEAGDPRSEELKAILVSHGRES